MVWKFLQKISDAAFSEVDEKLTEFYTAILNKPTGAFGEAPPEINRQHMLMLAYLCHLAYVVFRSGENVVREALIAPNTPIGLYRAQASFFPGDEQYMSFSVCSDTDLVFVLRGSADIRDWLQNISTALIGKEQIHAGFDRVAEQLWPWVIQTAKQRLSEPHNTINRIIFTGHSLGGAVAVLLSHRLQQIQTVLPKSTTIEAYTFGCPKIGSAALDLNYPLIAFRAIGDIIPEVTITPTYQPHGCGYLLTDRYQIIAGPDPDVMGLLNWGCMLGDMAKRLSYLMNTFVSEPSENAVWRFLARPFPEFCNPTTQMFKDFGSNTLVVMPMFILHFMSDAGRTRKGEGEVFFLRDPSKPVIGLIDFAVRATLYEHLDDAVSNRKAMIELSREKLTTNTLMKGYALLIMKKRHTIANYIDNLSLGAVKPAT